MVVKGGENSRRRGLVAVGSPSRGGEEELVVGVATARMRIEGGQGLEGRDWGFGMAISSLLADSYVVIRCSPSLSVACF